MDSGARCKNYNYKNIEKSIGYIYDLGGKEGLLKWDIKHKSIKKKIDDLIEI